MKKISICLCFIVFLFNICGCSPNEKNSINEIDNINVEETSTLATEDIPTDIDTAIENENPKLSFKLNGLDVDFSLNDKKFQNIKLQYELE